MHELTTAIARRTFLGRAAAACAGTAALACLGHSEQARADATAVTHHPPRARRMISLFQSGGPSQIDLLDYKPKLWDWHGTDLPPSVRGEQRLTGMTSQQARFPLIAPLAPFRQVGESGVWLSELLPYTAQVMDRLCLVRSLHTEAINHDPAITFLQTGSQQPGRPSTGAWLSYGLGRLADDLPAFVVMLSQGSGEDSNQGLLERLWGSGFLPASHQGTKLRSSGDPVLYLTDPPGIDRVQRRRMLDTLQELHQQQFAQAPHPDIAARIAQYELAFRMQTSVPDLLDLSDETAATLAAYGPDVERPGSFAANCLMARRLVERGVRFVQLYHRGWDQHRKLKHNLAAQTKDIDQPQSALLNDLAQRGLLDETLVVWSGEFGRSVYGQGAFNDDYGRDHHGRCFSMWLAGGGIRPGLVYGETDDHGFNIVKDPVHVHDLNATLLHCLGLDHERLTYRFQGRDYRLTDVHGRVITDWLT